MGMQMSPQNPTFESKAEEIFFKTLKDFNGLNDWHAMYDVRIQKHKHKRICSQLGEIIQKYSIYP